MRSYLVEHAEQIVSKDELIEAIWPNVIVTEDSLIQCISEVRRAIGVDAQALIKTVPKRGYMLDVPVTPPVRAPAPPLSMLKEPAISRHDKRGAAAELVVSPLEVGGRKQATAVYLEIGRTLAQVAEHDSEEALKIYEALLAALTRVIEHYGGTVTSVTEDSVVGVFGVPLTFEDHAVRACYAATEIQSTVGHSLSGIPHAARHELCIGIGIATGEIIARPFAGIREHAALRVMGPAMRQATRLGRAANGSILINPEASRLVGGYVQVTLPRAAIVEACGEPVLELVRMVPAQTRFQVRAARGLTPFVGRTKEMEHIEKAAANAHHGHGQVVAVIGDPGVGKSRLLYEFMRGAQTRSWLAFTTGAIAHRAPTSYQPLADLLKAYFEIAASDDAVMRHAKVVRKLDGIDGTITADLPAHLTLIDEHVDDPVWQALEPAGRREHIFDALKRLLLREARNQPIILAFEDLHWIDSETQAFLDVLVNSIALARVLIVVTYRPSYEHRWGGKSFYTQVRLEELDPDRSSELLGHLIGNDPSLADLTQFLQKQGNPLFLEELVRSLADDYTLEGRRGRYRLSRRLSDLRVPAAIQAIIAARIDRLTPSEKHLLQAAAAIGKDFAIGVLRTIASLPGSEFGLALAGLQNAELVLQTGFSADPSFTFKHALTHEVAYGSLLADQRHHFHTAIVTAIEKLSPDRRMERVEQLAHHASCGNLAEKAAQYHREAGTKAFARSSNREAVAHYEQALSWLAQLPETSGDAGASNRLAMRTSQRAVSAGRIRKDRRIFAGSGKTGAKTRRSIAPRMGLCVYEQPLFDDRRARERGERFGGALRSHR